jgi:hypothetical protein
LLLPIGAHAASAQCRPPEIGSEARPLTPPLGASVVGLGRLRFYSAPGARCATPGVFIIPNEVVTVHALTTDGWAEVDYFGAKSATDVSGWVRWARLKTTGRMGSSQ